MSYRATYDRLPLRSVIDLKGPKENVQNWTNIALLEEPNHRSGPVWHVGPEHWLLIDELAQEDSWLDTIAPDNAPPEVSVVRVSDTLTFFAITGADAHEIMSIACPMDLQPSTFGTDACSYTEIFGIKGLVTRRNDGFEIAVEQSFGDMIEDYLTRTLS